MVLSDVKLSEKVRLLSFKDKGLSKRLLEMGCLPGEIIAISKKAPLGDPIAIDVSGYQLCLRKDDARNIEVELV